MTDIDEQGRTEPPVAAGEVATLLGFLDYQRQTFAWKTGSLDAAGLQTTVGVSTMTLGGMLKHLSYVEEDWLAQCLLGLPARAPWDMVDWSADRDWEWHSAAEDSPGYLYGLWQESVELGRDCVARALTAGGLDQPAVRRWSDGRAPSLRWILCHLIEEYARHNGHADLIREAVDGVTGE
jgi:uncharacterized damage-inducible protein DinB